MGFKDAIKIPLNQLTCRITQADELMIRNIVMNKINLSLTCLATMMLSSSLLAKAEPMSVSYQVTFVPTWNQSTHPNEYPAKAERLGHFSGLIGATHLANYKIFAKGKKPTPGLENLSEHGKPSPLDSEIKAAIKAGKAGKLIQISSPIKGQVHDPVMTTFQISQKYPVVSMVAMIAPSPDWFVAVRARLYSHGKWQPMVVEKAYAWDSGGDNGKTFYADDIDTNPKLTSKPARTKHFVNKNGKAIPVGVFVFKRVPTQQ
jgi:Spondin_N